jgi:hypothetical protein
MDVYFIPGLCVNCKVFDGIVLPEKYEKKYIEWHIPADNETLEEYTRKMAENIDASKPFVIVGYSLGAIIMQEMNKFLRPEMNIVISSMKNKEERPLFFRFVKKTRLAKIFPKQLFAINNKKITYLFARLIYKMADDDIEKCVTQTSPSYMKWTVFQITEWMPTLQCKNLYHIHGTKDQTFPVKQIKNACLIEGGDHIMVLKKTEEINKALKTILPEI